MARFQIIPELTISGWKVKFWIMRLGPWDDGGSIHSTGPQPGWFTSLKPVPATRPDLAVDILGDEYCICLKILEHADCPIDFLFFCDNCLSTPSQIHSIQVENSPATDELRMGWRHAATTASYWCESSAQHLHCTLDSLKKLGRKWGVKRKTPWRSAAKSTLNLVCQSLLSLS